MTTPTTSASPLRRWRRGVEALRSGADIVTDTTMAMSGINKRVLAKFGGQVHNFIADPQVDETAKAAV